MCDAFVHLMQRQSISLESGRINRRQVRRSSREQRLLTFRMGPSDTFDICTTRQHIRVLCQDAAVLQKIYWSARTLLNANWLDLDILGKLQAHRPVIESQNN